MSLRCAFQDCLCIKYPCSRTAFFNLPTDGRRSTWIKNSGNKTLLNISATARRFFCENHFRQNDIHTQFNRKLLRRHAVPIAHKSSESPLEELEPNQTPHCSKLNEHVGEDEKEEELNIVIEQLERYPDTPHIYEDVEMPRLENQDNDSPSEKQLENSYTLLDFYIPADDNDVPEQNEEQTSDHDKFEDDTAGIYYVETSNNQVDSSTLDIHSDVDESEDELEEETEVPMKKRKPNEVALLEPTSNENALVTTSSNDYQEDKHFALSLVGYFQRLPKRKKALAKLKILHYLTELEIGSPSNL